MIALRPIIKIITAVIEQPAITQTIGIAVPLLSMPTSADEPAPKAIWIEPINAEALPASFVKGAIESADELGKLNPWQHK